ncbi:MAG: bifunctional nicotinamidase/pyrazinamidase [Myxococcota bacterium]
MPHTALLVIDVQNDFLPGGALAVPEGDAVVPVANLLIPRFELVVATQDFHPPGHLSFASQHPGKAPGEEITLHGLAQVLWPDHCVQGTRGADFAPGLALGDAAVFPKGTELSVDSYSGFFDNGRRTDTGLAAFLRSRGVRDVICLGLATDYCVRATAADAAAEGFRVTVVEDAVRAVDLSPGDGERALAALRDAGVGLTTSAELLRQA